VSGLRRALCILRSSWRAVFRRNELDQEIDDEVRSHLAPRPLSAWLYP
jgi:hypothetical protein